MFITDTATIETLTIAYINDALRAGTTKYIHDTRTDREERRQWVTITTEHGVQARARIQTIQTVDRTLATSIRAALGAIEDEAWATAAEHFGIDGTPRDIIEKLGDDYADVFDVIYAGVEDKARAQAQKIAARRAAEMEATR